MLTRIQLKNFKCFDHLDLELSKLNLLCGMNSSGKSTVFQALMLIYQSYLAGEFANWSLRLRGNWVDLGTSIEVLSGIMKGELTEISLTHDHDPWPWSVGLVRCKEPRNREVELVSLETGSDDDPLGYGREDIPPFGGETVYIGAERIGPRTDYPMPATRTQGEPDFGPNAEHAIHHIPDPSRFSGEESRCIGFDPEDTPNLVDHWLQYISPGVELDTTQADLSDAMLLRFRYPEMDDRAFLPMRPVNVGFGLSYVLPVIIALLQPAGTLCLIENPEAHLHPQGQTALGELAARAAVDGVQVIAETHSDHFMDGVRIAVRDGVIPPDDVKFHHFRREGITSTVTTPTIDEDGRLSEWPEGFFDQADINLDRLLAPRDLD